jgi:hypothetical protein
LPSSITAGDIAPRPRQYTGSTVQPSTRRQPEQLLAADAAARLGAAPAAPSFTGLLPKWW